MRARLRLGVFSCVFVFLMVCTPWNVWAGQVKYVFMFIGDGMGIPQRTAAEEYIGEKLLMNSLPAQGVTTTFAADRFITGSAPAATSIASGQKTNIGVVGMDPAHRAVKSLAEMAKEEGMKVGIVSSVSIDHATPAAFYAHVPQRGQYYDIDVALAESDLDYFAGGGLKDPTNSRKNSKNYKGNALELAKENGFTIVQDKTEFLNLKPGGGKVLAVNAWLQDSKALPYAMDRRDQDISLAEFTAKGIELLDNEQGFFMMVEGGKIDWACHANDGTASIYDTLAFDQSLQQAYDFYQKHQDETLIVVTGDHECGGMTLGYAGTKYATDFEILSKQKVSFQRFTASILPEFKANAQNADFSRMQEIITKTFGLHFAADENNPMTLKTHEIAKLKDAFARSMAGEQERSGNAETYLLYGGYDPLAVTLTHILNQKAGLAWTSYKHTGVPVMTSAVGVGSGMFNGSYDNTDIGLKVMDIMGLEPRVHLVDKEAGEKLAAVN